MNPFWSTHDHYRIIFSVFDVHYILIIHKEIIGKPAFKLRAFSHDLNFLDYLSFLVIFGKLLLKI